MRNLILQKQNNIKQRALEYWKAHKKEFQQMHHFFNAQLFCIAYLIGAEKESINKNCIINIKDKFSFILKNRITYYQMQETITGKKYPEIEQLRNALETIEKLVPIDEFIITIV